MSAAEELLPAEEDQPPTPGCDLEGLDEIHGHACDDCRLVWIGGFDAAEMGLPSDSATLGDSARGFAESAKHLACTEETSAGYFDCIFCNVTGISGRKVIAFMKP